MGSWATGVETDPRHESRTARTAGGHMHGAASFISARALRAASELENRHTCRASPGTAVVGWQVASPVNKPAGQLAGTIQQEREVTTQRPDAVCSVLETFRAGQEVTTQRPDAVCSVLETFRAGSRSLERACKAASGYYSAGKECNSMGTRCSLSRAGSFPSCIERSISGETGAEIKCHQNL
jgi:hypothetical protein